MNDDSRPSCRFAAVVVAAAMMSLAGCPPAKSGGGGPAEPLMLRAYLQRALDVLPDDKMRDFVSIMSCPTSQCGNAAKLGNEWLGALSTDGTADPIGASFKLVRGSLECNGQRGLDLVVKKGALVGVRGTTEVCVGDALRNARFTVRTSSHEYSIFVRDRAQVMTWETPQKAVTAYQFKWKRAGGPPTEEDVCPLKTPWDANVYGVATKTTVPSDFALVVQGETYLRDASVREQHARWFHLACAGTAIAKMRLLGMDPMRSTNFSGSLPDDAGDPNLANLTSRQLRQTTLKMITAKYCGEHSFTLTGTPLYIARRGAPIPTDQEAGVEIGPVESLWTETGALCFSHPRVGTRHVHPDVHTTWAKSVDEMCRLPACTDDDGRRCKRSDLASHEWMTCTVEHIAHP